MAETCQHPGCGRTLKANNRCGYCTKHARARNCGGCGRRCVRLSSELLCDDCRGPWEATCRAVRSLFPAGLFQPQNQEERIAQYQKLAARCEPLGNHYTLPATRADRRAERKARAASARAAARRARARGRTA